MALVELRAEVTLESHGNGKKKKVLVWYTFQCLIDRSHTMPQAATKLQILPLPPVILIILIIFNHF